MIKIENTEVVGWEHAIRGMRNPMNSWEKSDSKFEVLEKEPDDAIVVDWPGDAASWVGVNDQKLMMALRNAGTDHRADDHRISGHHGTALLVERVRYV